VDIQNASLAGGVAIGAAADMFTHLYGAILVCLEEVMIVFGGLFFFKIWVFFFFFFFCDSHSRGWHDCRLHIDARLHLPDACPGATRIAGMDSLSLLSLDFGFSFV
jgi:hypothetical protein